MRAELVAAAWLLSCALAQAEPRLAIRGFAGQVTIIPEAREDISVGRLRGGKALPAMVRRQGDVTVIDGGLEHRIKGCPDIDGEPHVRVTGLGNLAYDELPSLVIRTPRDVRVTSGDGVKGVIGRSETLDLANRGCGGWTIANVRDRARLSQIGSGELKAGGAGVSDLSVAGGGEIDLKSVVGTLTAVSTGEGSIRVSMIDGPAIARVAGSGDILVDSGGAPELNAQVAGSGAIRFGGSAGAVTALVTGPGAIDVAHVSGPVTRRIFGPGHIRLGS